MRKFIALILALALAAGMTCALADPESYNGEILPDFSTATLDGGTFTLSESLQTHDLVLINFWATWCGPCRMEFPYLETAWEQYGERVDVIALSIEETDTFDVLRSFADDYGLRFAIGRDTAGIFDTLGGTAIPTTLIVNRERRVVAVEIGSKSSAEEFAALFDELLSANAVSTAVRYAVRFVDPDGNPIPGVSVGFCNGEYTPMDSDADGRVVFEGASDEYHMHLLGVPAGYALPWDELQVHGGGFDITVTLYPD